MVDVGDKAETHRVARAEALVLMQAATMAMVERGSGKKGDVFSTARLAALSALKQTSTLIPLCHPVRVVACDVGLSIDPHLPGVRILVEVFAFDRTGVEMEAMVGASVAALTVYDMVKGVERGVTVGPIRLLEKSGGRSGRWKAEPKRRQSRQLARPGRSR